MSVSGITYVNRRKGPDLLTRLISLFVALCWLLALAVLFITGLAGPQAETFFDRLLQVDINQTWNPDLVPLILYLLAAILGLSILGIAINTRRHRRKSDRYRITFFITGIASIIGIIVYLATF